MQAICSSQVSFGVRNVRISSRLALLQSQSVASVQCLVVFVSQGLPFKSLIIGFFGAFILAKIIIPDFFLLSNIPFFSIYSEATLIVSFSICSTEVYIVKRHQQKKQVLKVKICFCIEFITQILNEYIY